MQLNIDKKLQKSYYKHKVAEMQQIKCIYAKGREL